MNKLIDIEDSENGLLTVTLTTLLNQIGPIGERLHWSIFYLYATGDLGEGQCIVELEEKVSNLEQGLILSWSELNELATKFDQMFDIIVVASADQNSITRCDNDKELYSKHLIVIELFDGAYWRIYAEDEDIVKNLETQFNETKYLNI